MSTFVLIHGGGDVGWYRHLVEAASAEVGTSPVAGAWMITFRAPPVR